MTWSAPKPLRIGPLSVDPPLLMAPMAGFTNYAFRQILRRLGGVGLLATEMLSARSFVHIEARGDELSDRLWGMRNEPRPLAVQIWDNNPDTLAAVGRRLAVDFRVSVVDVNFGCPVRDVSEKAQSGSYLLRDPNRVGDIIARVAAACAPVPVTAKIRLGCTRDTINAIDVAQALEDAGGAAVTVHGRTAADMFRGAADWEQIARIKPHLKSIPLIGNGDLATPQLVAEAFGRYGVDGAMIGRAALGKPWLFSQSQAALNDVPIPADPPLESQLQLLLEHHELVVQQHGPRTGTILMRRYAARYAQGLPGARNFRAQISQATNPDEFIDIARRCYPRGQ
jgi:tRNA-dihydrouridine synthase B